MQHDNVERRSSKVAQKYASTEGGIDDQWLNLQSFKNMVYQQKRVLKLNVRINRKKFENVLVWRIKSGPIINFRCIKTKDESLKVHLVRKKTEYEYTEFVLARELVKFGYSEWIQM